MTLETRRIGTTEIEVTVLGLGGGPVGQVGTTVGPAAAEAVVHAAYAAGVRYFDTAPLYGRGVSERRVGAALSTYPRDSFALSTKVGRLLVAAGQGEPEVRYDYSAAGARASLEASLERLGLERVDILLCHDIDAWTHGAEQPGIYETAARGILPALAELRAEGRIRAFGIGVNEWQVSSRVMDDFDVDCILLAGRFTLLEQDALDEMLPKAVRKQVSVIIGGPYNSGLLAVNERERATYDYRPVDDARWERAQQIRRVCDTHGVDPRAAALQYPLRHPAVAAVIPGARSEQEVAENVALVGATIPEALWDDLATAGLSRRW